MKKLLALLLLASACWGQTIRTSGSRLDRTDAEWATIAAKKTGTAAEQAQYGVFTAFITTYCSNPVSMTVNSANAGLCMLPYALAYKLDPTTYGTDYATKACALLKYNTTWDADNGGSFDDTTNINSGNDFRWAAPSIATAWSILRDHCNSVDTGVGDAVRDMATRSWNVYKPVGGTKRFVVYNSPYQADANIGVGEINSMVKLAIATYEPSTFTAPQTEWLPTIISSVITPYILPCLTATTAENSWEVCYGGAWQEGMAEYGPEAVALMVDLIDAFRVGTTDIDYWPSLSGIFPEYSADWALLGGTSPTGPQGPLYKLYQPFLFRDVQAPAGIAGYGYYVHYMKYAMNRMRTHLARIGDTTRAEHLQYWMNNIMPVYYINTAFPSNTRSFYYHFLLFEDTNYTATDWRSDPSPLDITTPYMLLSRSDWAEDATWFGVIAMAEGGGHQHADSGHFNIWRKGKWLTRERPGYYNERSVNPAELHNVLTLNGHGSHGGVNKATLVGHARMKRRTGGYMATANTTYSAAEMELGPVYKFTGYLISPDVDTVTRSMFYLKPDIWVVSDRIKYLTGLTARSIFHVQSEKGAAAISGNMATISNATQRLHVHKVFPSTADFLTPAESTCKIHDVRPRNDNSASLWTDCGSLGNNGATYSVTVSGFTGAYAALNGTHTMLNQLGNSGTELFQDGGGISTSAAMTGYNGQRMILNSTGLFADLPEYDPEQHGYGNTNLARNVQWNDPDINPSSPGSTVTHNPYRLDIHSGRKVNEESFLVVMQGADSTDTPMTVATLTSTTSNATGAAFTPPGGTLTEIIAPTLTTPTYPMCITRTGDPANHYVLGQVPGTTYKVSDSAGVTCINISGAGSDVVANNAGILNYQVDDSIQSPSITLVATPASLTASCVNGGSNPADQTVALTVTGDGGEAAISVSDDSAAISETLSGGSAPQNTPQTMTVAFGGCSGLSVGTHNLTISVASGTTYVVNSPLTIPVTVTVAADPLIAASPASVNFTATVSGANPSNQAVTITRTVAGDLGTITDDAAWLTVSPTTASSTTSQILTLSVDIAGLDPGQHTATITVPSTGASNTPLTIPVLLALDNPPVIGLEPRVGTTMIQFRYLAPSREPCTVRACTSPACSSVVASSSDGGGHPIRIFTLTGLTAATTYVGQVNCSGDIKARQVTTRAATGGPNITLPINISNPVGADHIIVDYGEDDSLSETGVEIPCSGGRCIGFVTWSNAYRMFWFKITYFDSMDNVIEPDGKIQSRSLIPE